MPGENKHVLSKTQVYITACHLALVVICYMFGLQQACPVKNTSLYHCMSLGTCNLLHVQFTTSVMANICTQHRITLLTCTNQNWLHPNVFLSDIRPLLVICHMSDGLTFSVPPLPKSRSELFMCVCGVFLSNKCVILMWLSYSKPSVCIRQLKTQCLH
jgi:hypothetical protein